MVRSPIIKGLKKGQFSFSNEDGFKVTQKLKCGKEIVYKEMNGHAKVAMNKKHENDTSGQCYALLSVLSSLPERSFLDLKGPDLKRAEYLGTMLLFS